MFGKNPGFVPQEVYLLPISVYFMWKNSTQIVNEKNLFLENSDAYTYKLNYSDDS